ncbi:MAG: hypothetical protein ABID09_08025 [Candidatus Omnitrophota bacterium]
MSIDFICPTCNMQMARDLFVVVPHTEKDIVAAIKKEHPKWATDDGLCMRCYEYYKKEMSRV